MKKTRPAALFAMPPGGAVGAFSEHLGAAYLRAVLASAGISTRQYAPARGATLETVARHLAAESPRVVGLTAYETNLRSCRAIVGVVRTVLPEAVVLVGGPNATFSPEETLTLLGVDGCVRGAAEGTITAILTAILGAPGARARLPDLLGGIRNLVLASPGGPIHTPPGDLSSFPGEPFRTLDDLPSPYQRGLLATAGVGLLTARGCNQHCTYCSFAAISGHRVHHHGVDRVLDDLEALAALWRRAGPSGRPVPVLDDAFTLSPPRARAICEGILARGIRLPLECATRADHVDEPLLRLMRRAGFVQVAFGLESGVPRVLRTIGKVRPPAAGGDPTWQAEREFLARFRLAIEQARAAGLAPKVSVIGGLPGESAADFRATLDFVESLGVESYVHNVLSVLPGTPLHRDQALHGIRAGRSPTTGHWRTHHAFPVGGVLPLPHATLRGDLRSEARQVADALCGYVRPRDTAAEGTGALVVHGGQVEAPLARWIAQVLEVHGTLVVLDDDAAAARRERGLRALLDGGAAWGLLAWLAPRAGAGPHRELLSWGTLGPHRFELLPEPRSLAGGPAPEDAGAWRVPVWIASGAPAPPVMAPAHGGGAPQIADGCRWWSRGRRCQRLGVLHVRPGGTVHPCWNGPAIGQVGDPYPQLLAAGRSLRLSPDGPTDACPIGPVEGDHRAAALGLERLELASQLSWMFQGEVKASG